MIMPHLCQHHLYTRDRGYFRMLFATYIHMIAVVPLNYFLFCWPRVFYVGRKEEEEVARGECDGDGASTSSTRSLARDSRCEHDVGGRREHVIGSHACSPGCSGGQQRTGDSVGKHQMLPPSFPSPWPPPGLDFATTPFGPSSSPAWSGLIIQLFIVYKFGFLNLPCCFQFNRCWLDRRTFVRIYVPHTPILS
jgi:hypothetical protein